MTVDIAGTMAELLLDDRWNHEAHECARIYFSQDIPVAVQNHQLECAGEPVFHSNSMCNDKKQQMDFFLSAWDLEAGQPISDGVVFWESWAMKLGTEKTSRWKHWSSC